MKKKKLRDQIPIVVCEAEPGKCPHCGEDLKIIQHRERYVTTLAGTIMIVSKDRGCNNKNCVGYMKFYRRPIEEITQVLNNREFGLDIIIYIGENYYRNHKSLPEIHEELEEQYYVDICEKTVGNLLQVYLALCNCVDADGERLREKLTRQGGIILGVDGVQFDDRNPVLYVLRDVISGEVLYAKRTILRGQDDLIEILEKVKHMSIPIIAIVTDKEQGLVPAIERVFPGIPYQWCQFHYLKNLATPVEEDLKKLGEGLRKGTVKLKTLRKKLLKRREEVLESPQIEAAVIEEIEVTLNLCERAIDAAKRSGKAPLEPPACKRYEALNSILNAARAASTKPAGTWRLLKELRFTLAFVEQLRALECRIWVRLCVVRDIAHVFKMDSSSSQVKRVLRTFINRLPLYRSARKNYMKLFIEHVRKVTDSYWDGLFHCYDNPLIPNTSAAIESAFGSTKRFLRRISGRKSTAGGIMETCSEFVFKARSVIKNVQNLPDKLRAIPYDVYREAMDRLRNLAEPARRRRSFLRRVGRYLKDVVQSWLGTDEFMYEF